jgi:nucleotidyltransferase substrate binding protein (TIGR01987 family)
MAGVMKERIEVFQKAFAKLEEIMRQEKSEFIRDAAILRFEYTVEAFWKAVKEYLGEREGLDAGSPKGVMREAHTVGLLTLEQTETALSMIDDRNRASHLYKEEMADEVYAKIPAYAAVMKAVGEKLKIS